LIAVVVVDLLLQLETAVEVLAKGFGRPGSGKSIPASSGVPQGEAGMPPGVAPGGGNWASASTNQ
jgi:hypothetical protein